MHPKQTNEIFKGNFKRKRNNDRTNDIKYYKDFDRDKAGSDQIAAGPNVGGP